MKALIIGVTGFVGKYLAEELVNAGWDVCGTRLPTETTDLDIPMSGLDILDASAVKSFLNRVKPDCVFHLAAQSSVAVSWEKPALTVDVNIKGAINLLEAVREMESPPRVLLIGSGEEYGYVMPEDLPVSEDTALRPGNIYAGTKIAQGMLGQIYARAYGLEIVVIRAFNHIGPGQTDTFVVPAFCKQVAEIEAAGDCGVMKTGNLEAKRDFTDVRDIVKAYLLLADKGESGEVYNVGSGDSIAIADILEMIIKLSKAKITVEKDPKRMRPSDTPEIRADVSKLVKCTGWKPEITLDVTISDVLNQWRGLSKKQKG
jgi:GDP-4-dehydro-6-deoxy-D-mannose reductase